MTKKHFIAIADKIRFCNRHGTTDAKFGDAQLDVLAAAFEEINPRFNRARWIDYIAGTCGPSGGTAKLPKETAKGDLLTE